MSDLTVMEKYHAAEAASLFYRLLVLDGIWTKRLDRKEPISRSDMGSLRDVANTMQTLLAECEQHAHRLREISQQKPELIEDIHRKIISSNRLTEEQLHRWQAMVERKGSMAKLVTWAMNTIVQERVNEQEQIKTKLQKIENSGIADGDLSFECGFLVGMMIGFAATGGLWWISAFTIAPIAAGVCADS